MGNSCSYRVATWVDDEEWGLDEPETVRCHEGKATRALEKLEKTSKEESGELSSTLVKIKITRKQLQELLRHDGGTEGLSSAHRLLADIMSTGVVCHARRRRRWRPCLQCIPEVDEDDNIHSLL